MILFVNVFLSDGGSPIGATNDRYLLLSFSKSDIFLYTMQSYSILDWSKVIIYCEFDKKNQVDSEKVYEKLKNLFPNASIYKKRNAQQKDWQNALQEIFAEPDDLVWYAGNHDHPYIAPNHIQLNNIVDCVQKS